MKILTHFALALTVGFSLVSCETYVGNEQLKNQTPATIRGQIAKGKTTKSQILQRFGKPRAKLTDENGNDIWAYQLAEIMYGKEKRLLVMFDRRGRVSKYSFMDFD